jgi:outer membrane biosynthesis protein TonB
MVGTLIRGAALAVVLSPVLAAQLPPAFTPPRILHADAPVPPSPTVAGGGEVLFELLIDRNGTPSRAVLLRSTPPYTQLMLDAIMRWQFEPALATNQKGEETAVDAPVLVAAVYRPPTLGHGPTVGESPTHLTVASGDVVYPADLVPPLYPPKAIGAGAVLFEVSLDEAGVISDARAIATDPAFESAARDALLQWKFRPALVRGRPAAASAYVLFGFRAPVVSSVR